MLKIVTIHLRIVSFLYCVLFFSVEFPFDHDKNIVNILHQSCVLYDRSGKLNYYNLLTALIITQAPFFNASVPVNNINSRSEYLECLRTVGGGVNSQQTLVVHLQA